jgi:hypothetical protein
MSKQELKQIVLPTNRFYSFESFITEHLQAISSTRESFRPVLNPLVAARRCATFASVAEQLETLMSARGAIAYPLAANSLPRAQGATHSAGGSNE